jgi:hypothetical protein
LKEGGIIPDGWTGPNGEGPDYCQRLLEREGVGFPNGKADPGKYVSWFTLKEREAR